MKSHKELLEEIEHLKETAELFRRDYYYMCHIYRELEEKYDNLAARRAKEFNDLGARKVKGKKYAVKDIETHFDGYHSSTYFGHRTAARIREDKRNARRKV